MTLSCLRRHVPAAVPGIVFLSGLSRIAPSRDGTDETRTFTRASRPSPTRPGATAPPVSGTFTDDMEMTQSVHGTNVR